MALRFDTVTNKISTVGGSPITINGPLAVNAVPALGMNGTTPLLNIGGAGSGDAFAMWQRYNNAVGGPDLAMYHSRSVTSGVHTILQSGDEIGSISFHGANGTAAPPKLARIIGKIDGVVGSPSDLPSRIEFYTTPDGSATTALAMTLNNAKALTVVGTVAWGGGSAITSSSNVPLLDAANTFSAANVFSAANNNFTGAYTSFNAVGFIRGDTANTMVFQGGTSGYLWRDSSNSNTRMSLTDAGVATITSTLAWGGGSAISSSNNVALLDAANVFTATPQRIVNTNAELRIQGDTTSFISFYNQAGSTRRGYIQTDPADGSLDIVNEVSGAVIALATTGGGAITFNGVAVSDFARLSQSNLFTLATGNAAPAISLANANPTLHWNETDAAVDNRTWALNVRGEQLQGVIINDANTVANLWLTVDRTGTTVDSVALTATTLDFNGTADISGSLAWGGGSAIASSNNVVSTTSKNIFTAQQRIAHSGSPITTTFGSPLLRIGDTGKTVKPAMFSVLHDGTAGGSPQLHASIAVTNRVGPSEIRLRAFAGSGTELSASAIGQWIDFVLNDVVHAELNDAGWDFFSAVARLSLRSTTSVSASLNNYNLGVNSISFITSAPTTLTGMIAGNPSNGTTGARMVYIVNDSAANSLTISHNSASSTATARFLLPGAAALTLVANEGATFIYGGSPSRWRLVGTGR